MTTTPAHHPRLVPSAKYANGAEWLHALGDVPLQRVVMDPPPGTATEQDLIVSVERDKKLVELIDGTLVEKPVGSEESLIAALLITALNTFVLPRKLGFVYGEAAMMRMARARRVRMPDVSFVSRERMAAHLKPHPAVLPFAPDLAVEVLSTTNTRREILDKMKEYFESGTRLAWVVDPPTRSVAVYVGPTDEPQRTLRAGEHLDGGSVLPGFDLAVSELFITEQ